MRRLSRCKNRRRLAAQWPDGHFFGVALFLVSPIYAVVNAGRARSRLRLEGTARQGVVTFIGNLSLLVCSGCGVFPRRAKCVLQRSRRRSGERAAQSECTLPDLLFFQVRLFSSVRHASGRKAWHCTPLFAGMIWPASVLLARSKEGPGGTPRPCVCRRSSARKPGAAANPTRPPPMPGGRRRKGDFPEVRVAHTMKAAARVSARAGQRPTSSPRSSGVWGFD